MLPIKKFSAIILCLMLAGCGMDDTPNPTATNGVSNALEHRASPIRQCGLSQGVSSDNVLDITFFWAPWSIESSHYFLELESLAIDFPNQLRVSKINIDNKSQWAGKWNITDLPTVLLRKNGRLIKRDDQLSMPRDLRRLVIQAMESE